MANPFMMEHILNTVVDGLSAIDIPYVNCENPEQAEKFLNSYGFATDTPDGQRKLLLLLSRSLIYLREVVLEEGEQIPKEISDVQTFEGILDILCLAADRSEHNSVLQRWACAVLRVAHVHVQLDHDLFSLHRHEIQAQVLKPLRACIRKNQGSHALEFVGPHLLEGIPLYKFEVKPEKESQSSITKLLAKKSTLAMNLLDRVGVRIVTRSKYDVFRILEILVSENIISFPHIVPDQSRNSLFPLGVVLEAVRLARSLEQSAAEIENSILEALSQHRDWGEKSNDFSSDEHRFLKFICRRLIFVSPQMSFFYPFEVQILDQESYLKSLTGPGAHEAYKQRQRLAARRRILGIGADMESPSEKEKVL